MNIQFWHVSKYNQKLYFELIVHFNIFCTFSYFNLYRLMLGLHNILHNLISHSQNSDIPTSSIIQVKKHGPLKITTSTAYRKLDNSKGAIILDFHLSRKNWVFLLHPFYEWCLNKCSDVIGNSEHSVIGSIGMDLRLNKEYKVRKILLYC